MRFVRSRPPSSRPAAVRCSGWRDSAGQPSARMLSMPIRWPRSEFGVHDRHGPSKIATACASGKRRGTCPGWRARVIGRGCLASQASTLLRQSKLKALEARLMTLATGRSDQPVLGDNPPGSGRSAGSAFLTLQVTDAKVLSLGPGVFCPSGPHHTARGTSTAGEQKLAGSPRTVRTEDFGDGLLVIGRPRESAPPQARRTCAVGLMGFAGCRNPEKVRAVRAWPTRLPRASSWAMIGSRLTYAGRRAGP